MDHSLHHDPSTTGNNEQKPSSEMSLADQILAMKAERDARANLQNAVTPTKSPSEVLSTTEEQPTAQQTRTEIETKPEVNTEIIEQPSETAAVIEEKQANSTQAHEEHLSTIGEIVYADESQNAVAAEAPTSEQAEATTMEAQSPEVHDDEDEHPEELTDFTSLNKTQLATELRNKLAQSQTGTQNSKVLTELYKLYQGKIKEERQEALNRFIETGGEAADFAFHPSAEDQAIEQAVNQFRENRSKQAKLHEEAKLKNLQAKQALLDKLRKTLDASENQQSLDEVKKIQAEWKAIGMVPQAESQELWNSYHALLDQYYNTRTIYNELKDLDRRRNLDAKLALCTRAEELQQENSINKALNELRHLHEEWKNIGPVPADARDTIWERFLKASEAVHQRKKQHLAERKAAEESNLSNKLEVLNMVKDFENYVADKISDWKSKTDELQKLKDIWEKIGLVPKEKAEEVNKKFWGIYKTFFNSKNAFFKALDDQKMENLRLKTQLCEEAERLQDAENFNETKEQYIQLQKKWKTIGRVPDKYSDPLWNRFRTACNTFFDKRTADLAAQDAIVEQQQTAVKAFVNNLEQQISTMATAQPEDIDRIAAEWQNVNQGRQKSLPKLEEKFYTLTEQLISKIAGLSDEERQEKMFQLELSTLKTQPDNGYAIAQKEQSLRKEIQNLEGSISTLKTNMDFFAKSKNAEQILKEYADKIADSTRRISEMKKRLKMLSQQRASK